MRFSRRPKKDTGLLRMTNWVAEIATSLRSSQWRNSKNQIPLTPFSKGEDWFLSIYFHSHLVPQRGMNIYIFPVITETSE